MTTGHRTAAAALLVLSLAATGEPSASARDVADAAGPAHHPPAVYSRQEKSVLPPNDPRPGAATTSTPPAIVRVETPNSGFDWGDAGIGAAGGLAISLLAVGGTLAVSGHRTRRSAANS
jgi:hypothetical protein